MMKIIAQSSKLLTQSDSIEARMRLIFYDARSNTPVMFDDLEVIE